MKSPEETWSKLAAAARRASDGREAAAPYGFAARVAARALSGERPRSLFLEHFSLRALGVASMLALVAAGAGYPAVVKLWSDNGAPPAALAPDAAAAQPAPSSDDPVAELVDMVS